MPFTFMLGSSKIQALANIKQWSLYTVIRKQTTVKVTALLPMPSVFKAMTSSLNSFIEASDFLTTKLKFVTQTFIRALK